MSVYTVPHGARSSAMLMRKHDNTRVAAACSPGTGRRRLQKRSGRTREKIRWLWWTVKIPRQWEQCHLQFTHTHTHAHPLQEDTDQRWPEHRGLGEEATAQEQRFSEGAPKASERGTHQALGPRASTRVPMPIHTGRAGISEHVHSLECDPSRCAATNPS